MITIDIKPFSVNQAWQGKRFKTKEYAKWREVIALLLPVFRMPPPPYVVCYEFGVSNCGSDWDNLIKCLQDSLQEKYEFNDRDIIEGHVRKIKVAKGKEYIKFDIYNIGEKPNPEYIFDNLLTP